VLYKPCTYLLTQIALTNNNQKYLFWV